MPKQEYKLVFAKSFRRNIRKTPVKIRENLINKISKMQNNPFGSQIKKLKNARIGQYRKRIGDYRIIFDVVNRNNEIWFYHIKHRKDIYKNI